MATRCSLVSAAARAFPPFLPPSLPSATAAGFFLLRCALGLSLLVAWPVAAPTMAAASWFGSLGMLDRFGMPGV